VNITASDVIAVIAILAGIVTTSVVALIGHFDRKGDHDHERTLAREARLQVRRERAYRDMLVMALRIQNVVDQTGRLFERVPPPERIPDPTIDQQEAMTAAVTLFGSGEVVGLLGAVVGATRAFHLAVQNLSDVKRIARPGVEDVGELHKVREDLDARRAAFHAAVAELERVAREELAS
jgi:hypothetical protein